MYVELALKAFVYIYFFVFHFFVLDAVECGRRALVVVSESVYLTTCIVW